MKQVAEDNRGAAAIHLAWIVEQAVQATGLMSYYADDNGDGPFMQHMKERANVHRNSR